MSVSLVKTYRFEWFDGYRVRHVMVDSLEKAHYRAKVCPYKDWTIYDSAWGVIESHIR